MNLNESIFFYSLVFFLVGFFYQLYLTFYFKIEKYSFFRELLLFIGGLVFFGFSFFSSFSFLSNSSVLSLVFFIIKVLNVFLVVWFFLFAVNFVRGLSSFFKGYDPYNSDLD